MKYLQLELTPTERAVHPIDGFIAGLEQVEREAILHVDSQPDEMTILYQLSGNRDRLETALAANDDVAVYELVDAEEGFNAYIQAASANPGSELISIAHEHALIIDTPIHITETGLSTTLVGTHDGLRQALASMPDEIDVTVQNAGPYTPGGEDLLSPLTDRQLEVFQTAVDQGYYDVPRNATHKDIADNLGCAPSTVDEHLRKAEARVVSALVD